METYVSNSGKEFIILSMTGKSCVVQFLETGTTRTVNIGNARAGKVRDLYSISVYGVGYYGDFEKVGYWKQAKQLWQNMMKRCYCKADERGYFGVSTVCARWHCFANFLADLPLLENFHQWLTGQTENAPKYNLDKDLKVPGNKVYAPEVCSFVTEYENKAAGARNGKPFTKKKKVDKELTILV